VDQPAAQLEAWKKYQLHDILQFSRQLDMTEQQKCFIVMLSESVSVDDGPWKMLSLNPDW